MDSNDPVFYGLPHREPFVFIDSVLEVLQDGKARTLKVFKGNEPFFLGHFPGNPIVPGVLLTEALAQTAGIAAGPCADGKSYQLSAIKQMKFLRSVRPGEVILLEASRVAGFGALQQFEVMATIAGALVATGLLVLNEET